MARVIVASLVILYGAFLLFASLVDTAMYGIDAQAIVRLLASITLLVVAGQVLATCRWASRVLAATLLAGALWSFATRHETRFPEEPPGGRAALLVVMGLALLYQREKRMDLRGRPPNNKMQQTSHG